MRYPAVIFDFDGTLADGYLAITQSANAVRGHYGLPPLSEHEIRPLVGRGLDALLRDVVPGGDTERDLALYRRHYAGVMFEGTRLYPPARQLVQGLQNSGRKLAVCSNKLSRFTGELLERLGLAPFFSAVLGPEQVAQPKPAPDMILEATRRLGVAPADTLYVGDMIVDVEAGRAAGTAVWAVATGSETLASLEASSPDRVFDDLSGVHAALLGPDA